MRCTRDDALPRENFPFTVSIEDQEDTLISVHEQWIRENGTGWWALDCDFPLDGLNWLYRFSDANTAFWFRIWFE